MPQTRKIAKKSSAYHHGDLKAAVLKAAEEILKSDGLNAVSIRACARKIGVSPTGPIHHFPSISSLLSELAALGFERLANALLNPMSKQNWTRMDVSWAYITFAVDNKQMFYLMNEPERLDSNNPALQSARAKAYQALGQSGSFTLDDLSTEQVAILGAGWGLCHGLSLLLIGGRLSGLRGLAPAGTTDKDIVQSALSLLDAAIEQRLQPRSRSSK